MRRPRRAAAALPGPSSMSRSGAPSISFSPSEESEESVSARSIISGDRDGGRLTTIGSSLS